LPIQIIMKQSTIIQYKILDFLGESILEVVDCRTKAGQERYKQLFRHFFYKRARKSTQIRLRANQRLLSEFLEVPSEPPSKRRKRGFYFRHYIPTSPKLQKRFALPFVDQQAIKSQSGYKGSLYQLFLDDELNYFSKWQKINGIQIHSGNCQVEDIFRLELARIRLSILETSNFLRKLQDWKELQVECGIEQKQIPTHSHYLQILQKVGHTGVWEYFHHLRRKCERMGLYDDKIDIWDARFLDCYQSSQNWKTRKSPPQTEPGVYVHQSKYFGVGYLESRIINNRFRLPKYYDLVNPQWNDNQIFQHSFLGMMEHEIAPAEIMIADGGPKGKTSRQCVQFFRSIPIFSAPKNAAGLVLVTAKNRLFYASDIPFKYRLILDRTFDHRTRVEQSFGYDSVTYNIKRIPHSGYNLSAQYIGLINCQRLLTAIAAVHTNQIGCLTAAGAFRRLSLANQDLSLPQVKLSINSFVSASQIK